MYLSPLRFLTTALLLAAVLMNGQSLAQESPPAPNADAPPAVTQLRADLQTALDDLAELKAKQADVSEPSVDRGDTAWMLTSTAFVMLMIPGLALFYAGMVRRKNVLATMMQSMAMLAVVGVYWVAVGYSLAFGPSILKVDLFGVEGGGLVGWSPDLIFLKGIEAKSLMPGLTIPTYLHVVFQGMFAIITPALISGAIAERIRFWPFCLFTILWITFVYCPLAHMVWAFDNFDLTAESPGSQAIGLFGKLGALDFAGGTVVHIAAGVAGLACALILGRRDGYPKMVIHPNSMVLTLVGAGLLWMGWFGFNGGSAVASDGRATLAFAATQAAAAAAGLTWMIIERLHNGKSTALGLASGIVAGLVGITPAAGFVYIWGGLIIGVLATVVCYLAVALKNKLGYDDSLDAFGIHGVGGFVGALLTGLLCYQAVGGAPGFLENGSLDQFIIQVKACLFAVVFSFVASCGFALLVQAITLGNFRTSKEDEITGLDQTEHGETGFDFGYATESYAVAASEPRPASTPRGNGRFKLNVEGVSAEELRSQWTSLCRPSEQPADPDFLAIYPHITTLTGTSFKARGADALKVTSQLERLLKKLLPGKTISVTRS